METKVRSKKKKNMPFVQLYWLPIREVLKQSSYSLIICVCEKSKPIFYVIFILILTTCFLLNTLVLWREFEWRSDF